MTPSSPHRPPPDRRVAGRPDARRLRAAAGRRLVALVTVVGLATACATSTGGDRAAGDATAPTTSPTPITDEPTTAAPRPTATSTATPTASDTAAPTGDPSPTDDGAPTWTRQPATPWRPGDGEVLVEAKRLAAATAVALTTHDPGADPAAVLAAALAGATPDEAAGDQADIGVVVRPDTWSRGRTVYPQLGGFAEDPGSGRATCSVMVVVEQTWGADDVPVIEQRTIDVRLARDDGEAPWRVTRIASVSGEPVPVDTTAHPVLADPRVLLPDAARWDIASGVIDPALLDLLVEIGAQFPVEVTVLERGHPVNVFATDRISAHTRGRAADIHTVDGATVASSHALGTATRTLVEWLYDDPRVTNIGSPWALDGRGGRSFTDLVHADHIHVAVRATTG